VRLVPEAFSAALAVLLEVQSFPVERLAALLLELPLAEQQFLAERHLLGRPLAAQLELQLLAAPLAELQSLAEHRPLALLPAKQHLVELLVEPLVV
jgi:hypothetical protein